MLQYLKNSSTNIHLFRGKMIQSHQDLTRPLTGHVTLETFIIENFFYKLTCKANGQFKN